MISHDLQDWLTRTSAEPAPLPRCCCEQSTCASSELFHDTIKRLEGESRLAAGTFIPPPANALLYFCRPFTNSHGRNWSKPVIEIREIRPGR